MGRRSKPSKEARKRKQRQDQARKNTDIEETQRIFSSKLCSLREQIQALQEEDQDMPEVKAKLNFLHQEYTRVTHLYAASEAFRPGPGALAFQVVMNCLKTREISRIDELAGQLKNFSQEEILEVIKRLRCLGLQLSEEGIKVNHAWAESYFQLFRLVHLEAANAAMRRQRRLLLTVEDIRAKTGWSFEKAENTLESLVEVGGLCFFLYNSPCSTQSGELGVDDGAPDNMRRYVLDLPMPKQQPTW